MLVVDTNVLLYAADRDAEHHEHCRSLVEGWRGDVAPVFLTWSICYEFLRVSTHPRVFRAPWTASAAWEFLEALLDASGLDVLIATDRHAAVLARTLAELPESRGNLLHDLHTAVLMREHGISRICTRDGHFHRFPFLTVLDPLRLERDA
jgi:toxin-antitoxin system PIN domain toxin